MAPGAVLGEEVVEEQPVDADSRPHDRQIEDARAGHLLEAAVHVVEIEDGRVRRAKDHVSRISTGRRRPDHEEAVAIGALVRPATRPQHRDRDRG